MEMSGRFVMTRLTRTNPLGVENCIRDRGMSKRVRLTDLTQVLNCSGSGFFLSGVAD